MGLKSSKFSHKIEAGVENNFERVKNKGAKMSKLAVVTDVEQENYSFKWKLKKFEDIKINQDWIEKAYIEFYAGSEVDRRSKWRVYLAQKNIDGKSETGIYFKCIEKPTSPGKNLFAKLYVRMKTDAGTDWKWNTVLRDMYSHPRGFGYPKAFSGKLPITDGTLELALTLTICGDLVTFDTTSQ